MRSSRSTWRSPHPPDVRQISVVTTRPSAATEITLASTVRAPATRASSIGLVENGIRKREARFMGAAKVGADAVRGLVSAEQTARLNDSSLARDPLRFDRIEPGTLDRQVAGEDADPVSLVLALLVVSPYPGPNSLADMPGGIVPDQCPHAHAGLLQVATAPA